MRLNFKTKELLSQEEMSQQEIAYVVEEAKLQWNSDVLATQKSLAAKKNELEVAKTSYPFSNKDIINLEIEVESLEDGLKRLKKLGEERGF